MSIVDISLDLENLPDQMLQQLGQGGDPQYPQYLVLAEVQRRADMRQRYQAQQAKQQAANPPDIATQRLAELGGGIPGADPNMAPPDPSLQTGIAGPPQMAAASGGFIRGYDGGGPVNHPHPHRSLEDITEAYLSDLTLGGPNLSEGIREGYEARAPGASEYDYGSAVGGIEEADRISKELDLLWNRTKREEGRNPTEEEIQAVREGGRASITGQVASALSAPSREQAVAQALTSEISDEALAELSEQLAPTTTDPDKEIIVGQETHPYVERIGLGGDELTPAELRNLKINDPEGYALYMGPGRTEGPEAYAKFIEDELGIAPKTPSAEEEGGVQDWIDAFLKDRQAGRAQSMGLIREGLDEAQRIEDLFTTRTDADRAHKAARIAGSAADVEAAEGIMGIEQGEIDRRRDYAGRRGILSRDIVDRYEALEAERAAKRPDRLQAAMSGNIPLGFEDDYGAVTDAAEAMGVKFQGEEDAALEDIVTQLEEGMTWEDTDYGEVYDLSKSAQGDLDKAIKADRDLGTTILGEDANRARNIAKDLLKDRLGLYQTGAKEAGASERASISANADRVRAELAAKSQGKNFLADPSNWEHVELLYDEHIDQLDPQDFPSTAAYEQRVSEIKAEKVMVGDYMTGLQTRTAITGALPHTTESRSRSQSTTRHLTPDQLSVNLLGG